MQVATLVFRSSEEGEAEQSDSSWGEGEGEEGGSEVSSLASPDVASLALPISWQELRLCCRGLSKFSLALTQPAPSTTNKTSLIINQEENIII